MAEPIRRRPVSCGQAAQRSLIMTDIRKSRILIIATNGFEQSELTVPRDRLKEAGATVEVASPDGKAIRGWKEKDWGDKVEVDLALSAVKPDQYDALVIPGGQMNPDTLRDRKSVV